MIRIYRIFVFTEHCLTEDFELKNFAKLIGQQIRWSHLFIYVIISYLNLIQKYLQSNC